MGTGPQPARRPTLDQVAKVAGVSRATVSRVVNRVESVDPDIREVVERAIADTGYVPNRAARPRAGGLRRPQRPAGHGPRRPW